MMKLNQKELQKRQNFSLLLLDLSMLILVLLDLMWMVFDWLMYTPFFSFTAENVFPQFYAVYDAKFHEFFLWFDSAVVIIFLSEVAIRWAIAIVRQTYYRWFFYPFIHWYDVLGCIPGGSYRVLRLIRLFTVLYRLHRKQIIDLSNTTLYRIVNKYYTIAVEEVSDRVVINVLEGAREELKQGQPVTDEVIKEVIQPRRDVIVAWLAARLRDLSTKYYPEYRPKVETYVDELIQKAMRNSKEVAALERLPMVGSRLTDAVATIISDVVFGVIDRGAQDIGDEENDVVVGAVIDVFSEAISLTEQDAVQYSISTDVITEVIEVLIRRVAAKRWQVNTLPTRDDELEQARQRVEAKLRHWRMERRARKTKKPFR